MVLCGNADGYRGKIEKVRFGARIEEAFPREIPATLLVLLLKVNKEGPNKKDIWRAPGNHAQIRTLARHMRDGTLVNISHFDEKTVASVIKLFLSKIPGGIFGYENERWLIDNFPRASPEDQRQLFCRVIGSLCHPSQHLLVLLFGTFHMVSEAADGGAAVKMTPDALGISVAPSLFHSCIHMREAKIEDVMRSKIASEIISKVIQNFGHVNLFPKYCYEFYARMTGRTMRVEENAVKLAFALPNNAHDWPVPLSTPFTFMAAKYAGSYSFSTVSGLERSGEYEDTSDLEKENALRIRPPGSSPSFGKLPATSAGTIERPGNVGDNGYGHTFFGIGSEPITVATVADNGVTENCFRHSNRLKSASPSEHEFASSDLDLEYISSSEF